jgi:hypothetical protein
MALDKDRLQAFMERYAADQAATMHSATVVVGDQLGLYRALADGGPQTADELAAATGCQPRLVREWLNAQVASAYCEYDQERGGYSLTQEQAACLADPTSPTFLAGGALVASSTHKDTERVRQAFTADGGIAWDEHHPHLFAGTERFFGPVYRASLVSNWIPALDGVEQKLASGARVADIGCGHGASLLLLAEAYPASTFVGFDYHPGSIDAAREAAGEAGVGDRVTFEVAGADDFAGEGAPRRRRTRRERAGPDLLLCVDLRLHPQCAVPGRRGRAGRPGRRGQAATRGRGRRFHPVPTGHRDTDVHDPRGSPLSRFSDALDDQGDRRTRG